MVLAAGDHRLAFQVLAGRHLGPLTRFCIKFLGGTDVGEELAQDVLVEAWSRRRSYRPSGRFKVFLLAMARTRCLNRLRDEGRRRRWLAAAAHDEDTGSAPVSQTDQLDDLLARERARRVREAVAALPTKLREALLLRFDQALPYSDIAQLVGRNEVTVRSRVFHALRRLRRVLGEEVK